MRREPVRSRSIKSIGYEHAKQILEIEFRDGPRVYQYYGVPLDIYGRLMTAESKGTFVNQLIKAFPYREIFEETSGPRGTKSKATRIRRGPRQSRHKRARSAKA
jgi:hypothetical protein